jgi:hypothetical protein
MTMASASFTNRVLSHAPLLYFRFNDGHLTSQAIDSSVHGNHGQYSLSGTARLESVAATDAAVRFSGGKITVPTGPVLNPPFITMEALLIWRGPNGYQQRILEKSTSPSGVQALYGLSILDDGRVRVEIKSSAAFELTSSVAIPQHQPVHVVATYNGVWITLYLNGRKDVATAATGPLENAAGAQDLGIGNQVARVRPFNGLLDEVAIYAYALSYASIRSHASAVRELFLPPAKCPMIGTVPMSVHLPPEPLTNTASFPVQFGVPFPRGTLTAPQRVRIRNDAQQIIRSQTRVLGWWGAPENTSDGVKWLQVAFDADVTSSPEYTLEYGNCVVPVPPSPLKVQSSANGITVDTGVLKFFVRRANPTLIDQAWLDRDGNGVYDASEQVLGTSTLHGLYLTDQNGVAHRAALDPAATLEIEDLGPQQVTLKASGAYVNTVTAALLNQWTVRIKAYANKPYVRIYHTFVITEGGADAQFNDIGFDLPLALDTQRTLTFARGTDAVIGTDLPEPVNQANNLVFGPGDLATHGSVLLHQNNDKEYSLYDGAGNIIAVPVAGRSGHWFDISGDHFGMGVALRWLWQKHPAGLEWTADGSMRVHLWTQRGQSTLDLRAQPYLESRSRWTTWNQEFQSWQANNPLKANCSQNPHVYPYCTALAATGVGVSNTHEILIHFHPAGAADEVAEPAYLLQRPLIGQADPQWLRSSEAMGKLHPLDPLRFPGLEAVLGTYMDRFRKDQSDDAGIPNATYGDSYGLFDFGDTLHQEKEAHRYWSHMFYVEPSVWWTQFARTGDRRFFEFGEANARHHMDVDTGHFAGAGDSAVGAFNHDESGIIHWSIYQQTINSTANYLPYLTAYHYQTGYERAKDVALEVGAMILSQVAQSGYPIYQDRGSGPSLWAAVELEEFTGNAAFLALADHIVHDPIQGLVFWVRDDIATGDENPDTYPSPADFTLAYIFPGAIAYHRRTNDPDIAKWIENQAKYIAHYRDHRHLGVDFTLWQGLAYAYHLTGDAMLLPAAKWNLDRIGQYTDQDVRWFIGDRVWWMYNAGYLMDALVAAGNGDPDAVLASPPPEQTAQEIQLHKSIDQDFEIEVRLFGIYLGDPRPEIVNTHDKPDQFAVEASLKLYAPDGTGVESQEYKILGLGPIDLWYIHWYNHGGWVKKFIVPADGQTGNYRLAVVRDPPSEKTLFSVLLIHNSLGMAMYRGAGDGISPGGRGPIAKQYFFHVPTGTTEFSLEFFLYRYCYNFPVTISDPDGNVVYKQDLGMLLDAGGNLCCKNPNATDHWETIPLTAAPPTQDRFWSVDLGVSISDGKPHETRPFRLVGIPPYFGESQASSFAPTP